MSDKDIDADDDAPDMTEAMQGILAESLTNMRATSHLSRWQKLKLSVAGWRTIVGMTPALAVGIDVLTITLALAGAYLVGGTLAWGVGAVIASVGVFGLLEKGARRWRS